MEQVRKKDAKIMPKNSVSQRDVVLIPFPFSDLRQNKFRPAVVVSNDAYNRKFRDFIAVAMTSNTSAREHTIIVTGKEMDSGSLPMKSAVKADKVLSLEQNLVVGTFGQLRQDIFKNISSELIKLIS